MKKYFLNTPIASWIKVFISAILAEILIELQKGKSLFTWDIEMASKVLTTALLSLLPMIINYLNPNDPRYGIKKINNNK